ncbi:MAG: SDR family oxidoreductase [Chlorobium sp.]
MGRLDHKVAVITGSTRGIGKAIAHEFVREGAKVVITSSSSAHVEHALREFPDGAVYGCICDVVVMADVERLITVACEKFGKVDCFINNAGISDPFKSITDSDPDEWAKVIDTNIKGTYNGCRAAISYFLREKREGKVINLAGSGTDRTSNTPWISAYGATKAAIARFTYAVAAEYRHTGISVMLLHPGLVRTAMVSADNPTPELSRQLSTFTTILDIFAQPPSVAAKLAVKLASNWSDSKTGLYLSALSSSRKKGLLLTYPFRKIFNKIDRRTY